MLLALQVIWLKSAYEKAFFDLRRESSQIFRNTIFQLRDSVFVRTIEPSADSMYAVITKLQGNQIDKIQNKISADSTNFKSKTSTVQVFISSSDVGDSLVKSLGPLSRRFQNFNSDGNRNFMIRIAPDTLNLDSLTSYFQKNLLISSIHAIGKVSEIAFRNRSISFSHFPLPMNEEQGREEFIIHEKQKSLFNDTLNTEPTRLNPSKYYRAQLIGIRGILLKEVAPQFLFSVFLTLTILAAFLFMYRNIRTQQKVMMLKNDFISNVSHELKTPIATVSVALEALKDFNATANPVRSKEYISIAQTELNRLSEITDKILRTTVLEERGENSIANEKVDLKNLIKKSCSTLQLLIEKEGAQINIQTPNEDCFVSGSELHLSNVLSNLLENSLKYSIPNQKTVIQIALKIEQKNIQLSIKDNGIGIAEEYKLKIFEKFFRVPTGNLHAVKGYGLGLNYVVNVVKAHNGKIHLTSKLDEGSEFVIIFPKPVQ